MWTFVGRIFGYLNSFRHKVYYVWGKVSKKKRRKLNIFCVGRTPTHPPLKTKKVFLQHIHQKYNVIQKTAAHPKLIFLDFLFCNFWTFFPMTLACKYSSEWVGEPDSRWKLVDLLDSQMFMRILALCYGIPHPSETTQSFWILGVLRISNGILRTCWIFTQPSVRTTQFSELFVFEIWIWALFYKPPEKNSI